MGCIVSTPKDSGGNRRRPASIGELTVYVPGFRIPKPVDFSLALGDHLSKNLVEQLSALRTRIVVMAGQEAPTVTRTRRRATQHGGSTLADLHQALEDYLPVLVGLVKDGSQLQHTIQFVWMNQEDEAEETAMSNAWYEILSVLHLMAVLSLSQANLLLLPRTSSDGYQPKVSEESRRASVDIFLKAAGYLDCAVRHVLPHLPAALRRDLPVDLVEGVLRALSLQALGQSVDIQLGMAIDSAKATLAVKRRLACEMVKYWQQAQDNIMNLPLANGWGEKHRLFIKWKHVEAKVRVSVLHLSSHPAVSIKLHMFTENWYRNLDQAAAYYYHGLILDEGNTEKSHGMAVAALQAADEFFKESKRACEAFNSASPTSR
ncbi:hypothetical protein LINPERPRIM_LOCUS12338 [Linum perenne]